VKPSEPEHVETRSAQLLGPELRITAPDGSVRRVSLEAARYTVGRSSETNLCFHDDAALSRKHFEVEREGQQWYVRDLGSRNGTQVNGSRVASRLALRSGDTVHAGSLKLQFSTASQDQSVVFVETTETVGSSAVVARRDSLVHSSDASGLGSGSPEQMSVLIRAGRELTGHRPLSELFSIILDLATEGASAQRGVVMVIEEGERLAVAASKGHDPSSGSFAEASGGGNGAAVPARR
jgi:pSer/pThr/pTyr-binding forkhead associated (FHA) protein